MHDVLSVLRSPRIIGLAVLTVVLAILFAFLSSWQRDRAAVEGAKAELFTDNVAAEPLNVEESFAPGQPLPPELEWRAATEAGTYDAAAQVLVRNRAQDGRNGMVVAAPLRTESGAWLWVARGWIPAGRAASSVVTAPAPPSGPVTVSGVLRPSETPDETQPADLPLGQVSALDVSSLSTGLDGPAYGVVLQADLEDPAPAEVLTPVLPPTGVGGNWQNISYALQWAAFAVIAVVGFGMIVRLEVRQRRQGGEAAAAAPQPEPGAENAIGAMPAPYGTEPAPYATEPERGAASPPPA